MSYWNWPGEGSCHIGDWPGEGSCHIGNWPGEGSCHIGNWPGRVVVAVTSVIPGSSSVKFVTGSLH